MWDLPSIYSPANRAKLLVIAGFLVTAIAVIDWLIEPYVSLGFLYLFPVMIVGGYLSRKQIIGVALVCALLQEAFSDLPEQEALVRLVFSSAGFIGTGLFISELLHNRRIILKHVEELKDQIKYDNTPRRSCVSWWKAAQPRSSQSIRTGRFSW